MATAFPTLSRKPSRQSWSLQSNTQVHVSPLDGSVQTQSLPGARWLTTIEYDNLLPSDAARLQAFLLNLNGRSGRALIGNFGQPRSRGTINGTPLVNGAASALATTLATDGWGSGGAVKAGDFFGVGGRMYQVAADASATAGAMTISVSPPLQAAVLDNAALTFVAPTTTMMLVDDRQGWQYVPGLVRSYVLDFVEVA